MGDERRAALAGLGITPAMVAACRAPACAEARALVDAGQDILGRAQRMTAETLRSWRAMQGAAAGGGVTLQLVSAYRSFEYQCGLVRGKLERGWALEDILQVNAIPGYSEHHSGEALDLHDGMGTPLTQAFDERAAFAWLVANGGGFGFSLSYPKGNEFGMIYEPWHWRYGGGARGPEGG